MARQLQQCQLMQQPCLALFFVFYLAFCVQEVQANKGADIVAGIMIALIVLTCVCAGLGYYARSKQQL
jgi:hypothetical protein